MQRILFLIIIMVFLSCGSKPSSEPRAPQPPGPYKPASGFTDTLWIDSASAVFFKPGSSQLDRIRALTEDQVFRGMEHEYDYQQRNARIYFGEWWPDLPLVNAEHIRYIGFRSGENIFFSDLDSLDPYGIILFNGISQPRLIDMTNIDTEVPDYFSSAVHDAPLE